MNPQQLTHRLNEAIAHHKAGRYDRAEAIYRQLAPLAQRNALVYQLWGQLVEQQGRYDEATRCYAQALRIDATNIPASCRLAAMYIAQGRLAEAEAVLRTACKKVPNSHEVWNTLGFVLKMRAKLNDALACHKKAVELNPKFVEGWCHLGLTLGVAGHNHEAMPHYDRALELDPNCWLARYGRAQSLHKTYRIEESVAEYDAVLKAQPKHLEARSYRLYAIQHLDMSREQLFAEHCAYGKEAATAESSFEDHDFSPHRRLRLAILSPDLRTHSCAYFLEPLLRHLNSAEFEVVLYHDHFLEDEMTARLRQYAVTYRNFVGQPAAVVERTIRGDKPDILIDLCGHIAATVRLPLFAKRLAPVQMTYLGYPDTTGVPNMDFRFTDAVADPVGEADRFATEKLVRFSSTAWAYQPPADAPGVSPLPCQAGAPITFGSFNSPIKFTVGLYAAWSELLRAVPSSRLVLKGRDLEHRDVRDLIEGKMRASGIPMDRVALMPRTSTTAEHLAQYAMIDIALDTFPYTGTTTTCEALWMGRPVVTFCGDRHAARVSASLLRAVGHEEWIASSPADYVRIAAALAADLPHLQSCSANLRAQMAGSTLMDHKSQSARFAVALRACWIARCARQITSTDPNLAAVAAS